MNLVGDITGYVDLAQIILYIFWIFFAGLLYYLVRENHREGYPMESEGLSRVALKGYPVPPSKTYKLHDGTSVTVPDPRKDSQPIAARNTSKVPGSPIEPTGNPMIDGVGPAAYPLRADVPERDWHGQPLLRPLRDAKAFGVVAGEIDPRGLPVVGGDNKVGGKVVDLWIDTAEMMFRYLELEVPTGSGARRVLLPMPFARVRRNMVEVSSIYSHHFATVPVTKNPNQVTKLEEERIAAYYGGGTLYADPKRAEPIL